MTFRTKWNVYILDVAHFASIPSVYRVQRKKDISKSVFCTQMVLMNGTLTRLGGMVWEGLSLHVDGKGQKFYMSDPVEMQRVEAQLWKFGAV